MRIAITGKIGSGKTEVCNILKRNGYKVFSADEIYNELISNNADFVLEISEKLGINPIKNGDKILLDKKSVSQNIFNDQSKRTLLNKITHEKVMQKLLSITYGDGTYFCEIPLLADITNPELYFNEVWLVKRDLTKQVNSLEKRDGIDKEFALKKINSQKEYVINSKIKHTVIYNDEDLPSLEKQVLTLCEKYQK